MSGKRYSEVFKIEAVKQVTERGYKVTDVCRADSRRSLPPIPRESCH